MSDEEPQQQLPQPQHISLEETAYRSLLPGVEYALKCVLQELNQLRLKLGYQPVTVEGLGEGWSRPRKGGITESGREALRQMMRERWEKAKAEGKHVKDLRPPTKPTKKKPPKPL